MSLRLRLAVGLVVLVALGLAALDGATYLALQPYLINQVDTQLTTSASSVGDCLHYLQIVPSAVSCPDILVPSGTFARLQSTGSGTTIISRQFVGTGRSVPEPPALPRGFGSGVGTVSQFTTVSAIHGDGSYRVLSGAINQDTVLVLAIPLTNVNSTLNQLRLLEVLVSFMVLVLLGVISWWTVQFGLRPLRRIRDTAQKIAAGDLSQRVEGADPTTEVGQLAVSLNEMLAQIERAFAERSASEARLRRFAADASHELRTPLSSIRGYAELFRRGARANPEDLDKAMSRIESEAIRMGILVEDLLLLARLDQGRPLDLRPVDLSELAVDAAADQSAADRRHRITVTAPDPVPVPGDEARLRQVVANLVRNAVVHTPAGTMVEISTRIEGDFGVVEVADHGPGIPEGVAERVFERFYRADQSRGRGTGGTGLGLSIVSAIVAAHRGRVSLRTTPGGGATFTVQVPRIAAAEPAPAAEPSAAGAVEPSPVG